MVEQIMQEITFPAKMEKLYEMLEFIRACSRKIGFDESILEKIILATEEVLVNVISYSYPNDPGSIVITCSKTIEIPGIKILVSDEGIPFNPLEEGPIKNCAEVPPLPSIDNCQVGGYGIFLVKKVMDRVEYNYVGGNNILSLEKHL